MVEFESAEPRVSVGVFSSSTQASIPKRLHVHTSPALGVEPLKEGERLAY